MSSFLLITVRWLDDRYHGLLGRDGPPEWPPSPYRLLQAMVAGAARAGKLDGLADSLRWLERLDPPIIIAPPAGAGQIITRFVPNNDGDKKPDRQNRLTGKTSYPTIMLNTPEVHYLWPLNDSVSQADGVIDAAQCIICLGWGIDMAYADARKINESEVGKIPGIRWHPKSGVLRDDGLLRVPKGGTLDDLLTMHQSALNRIEHGKPLKVVEKPQVFDAVFYSSSGHPLGRPYAIFALRHTDGEPFSHPQCKLIHIAGMVRNAAIKAMEVKNGFPPPGLEDPAHWVENFVAGHRNGRDGHQQFSYIPLPSIGNQHADALIRRVMILAPHGCESHLRHLAEQLDGCQMQREGGGAAPILERVRGDGVIHQYTQCSTAWATVTPIILPGHDDHKPAKTRKLLLAALRQNGIEQPCEFTWGAVPNFPHCLSAYSRDRQGRPIGYFRPDHLRLLTAVHARITFTDPFAGPLAIGAGRHCGFGICAVPI